MQSTEAEVEQIPDADVVSRQLFWPRMFGPEGKGPLDPSAFFEFPSSPEFPGGQPESVVWRKHKPTDEDVHALGCAAEALKRERKPNVRYTGFRNAVVAELRKFRTARGHGFEVLHEPSEGIHHAEVSYVSADGNPANLKKTDKGELRAKLGEIFAEELSHACW